MNERSEFLYACWVAHWRLRQGALPRGSVMNTLGRLFFTEAIAPFVDERLGKTGSLPSIEEALAYVSSEGRRRQPEAAR